ncbi:hypothetical protein BKA70DRAFT_1314390 [Coprinopsis sp. MPI-PUGE-AT-0042]|nr:hypothetical protein BKA70DRAFT_1579944 [Coprinopsis sp. MPI-PUGE-AT-0042]KAH6866234.1 hypothetical protein BKA70DRAFT_1362640 [Coprinopsis sp. MPI-PUGE-AT-0042]KAH6886628.1 hypothetical protein BKA70DRAFT_1334676 [Coprinopsis sp. MPI-PUGE-AT-0042]KAH6887224.1 hypothetical protein BKA70DRAFT_1333533 [Coprinopsis sp. MPI-PUGE-AT-0042]KAH6899435.1 hypothetical protein BKA70DRAFT_1314390 [Coprinopsis sp. MPI-PUGE-AT-0042]
MLSLDPASIAEFIRNEETKRLFECLQDRQSWNAFLGSLDSPAFCSSCSIADPEVPCVTQKLTIGCHRCFITLDECSLVNDFRQAVLVNDFNHTTATAKEYLLDLSALEAHLRSIGGARRVPTWKEVEAVEQCAQSGDERLRSALNDFRILHLRMELEHNRLWRIVESYESTILEVNICCTEAIRTARAIDGGVDATAGVKPFREAVWSIERMSRDALDADENIALSDDESSNA